MLQGKIGIKSIVDLKMGVEHWNCDLCHSGDYTPIEVARPYIGDNEPPVVCMGCGFIYVRERRSSAEVAKSWDNIWGEGYTSEWPAVKARLFYVTEWLDQIIGLEGKSLLDIGAGEGTFLKMARECGAFVAAVEPYKENVQKLRAVPIVTYSGIIEGCPIDNNDIITILWTLENCADCIGMLKRARELLKPDGVVVVATGSRILVPFKKPLSKYFSDNSADTHCFRFSYDTLVGAMEIAGLGVGISENRFQDSDWMIVMGKPGSEIDVDYYNNPTKVLDFFQSWSEQFP